MAANWSYVYPDDGFGSAYVDTLVWGCKWTGGPITYAFASGSVPGSSTTGVAWTTESQNAFRSAFALYQNVCNITFQEVTYAPSAPANINTFQVGHAYWGATGPVGEFDYPLNTSIYGHFNSDRANWSNKAQGGESFAAIIHEMGHALGLAHPFNGGYTTSGYQFPGVPFNSQTALGDYSLNQGIWTVMSYNHGWNQLPNSGSDYGWQATPMALDIAALQVIYGANNSYNTGDNTYTLVATRTLGTGWQCIWDAGGTDTISNAGSSTASTINLNAATLIGENAGGYVSWNNGINGGYTIANGVVIENVIGGNAADVITGNASNNQLKGNGGNDTLYGGDGVDTAVFNYARSQYTVTYNSTAQEYQLANNSGDGTDTVSGVEFFQFSDRTVAANNLLTSIDSMTISNTNNPPNGSVYFSGSARIGQTLTVSNNVSDADGMPSSVSYQWLADGVVINNATGTQYTVKPSDIGKALSVVMSYVDGLNNPESIISNSSDPVPQQEVAATTGVILQQFQNKSVFAEDAIVLDNGKVLVALSVTNEPTIGNAWENLETDVVIERLNATGAVDSSFGTEGKLTIDLGQHDYLDSLVSAEQGKFLALVNSSDPQNEAAHAATLRKYNANGTLDTTFSNGGILEITNSGWSSSMAIQANGKIVVGGSTNEGMLFVNRYDSNGTLDTTFSSDGRTEFSYTGANQSYPNKALISSDGSIYIIGGYSNYSTSEYGSFLAHINAQGAIDTAFGTNGFVRLSSGYGLAQQSDGKILIGSTDYENHQILISRYTQTGVLDTSFAGDGTANLNLGSYTYTINNGMQDWFGDLVIQPDGKILVGASAYNGSDMDFAVARLNQNGSLDSTFSSDGKAIQKLGGFDQLSELTLQADGKILLTGYTDAYGNDSAAIVRLTSSGELDAAFNAVSDTNGPTVSTFSPGDGVTGARANSNIVLTFDESIQRGTGNIEIHSGSANGALVERFNATSSNRLTFSGNQLTIDPTKDLAGSTKYFVTFASGTVKDLTGNANSALSTYDFTTGVVDTKAPTVTTFSPKAGLVDVLVNSNIALTFSEAVTLDSGYIQIRSGSASGSLVESFDVSSSSRLALSGNVLTIDPTSNLAGSTKYFITIGNGAIKDLAGNAYVGTTTYSFTTGLEQGTEGNDTLFGSAKADTLYGYGGNDAIDGRAGADKMYGGSGNDSYTVDNSKDLIYENAGEGDWDFVTATTTYTLSANIECLLLDGSAAISGTGNASNNILEGNSGKNTLSGLGGDDELYGARGGDTLIGGAGNDTFVFGPGDTGQAKNFEIIKDFTKGSDSIDYYAGSLRIGGTADTPTATQASINQSTGVATFAAKSGTTLADALNDVAVRLTAGTDAPGEFAFFKVNNKGDYYLFISDGASGVTANDDVIQLVGVSSINQISVQNDSLLSIIG